MSEIQTYKSFDDMNLKDDLLRGIFSYGFERPSAIQQKAIKPITQGKDVIVQAQSGNGKTATFSIGLLQQIDDKIKDLQALVLAPTRELAMQSNYVINSLGHYLGLTINLFVGGTLVKDDLQNLKQGVQVAVGTPGRILDLVKRGQMNVSKLKIIVIDEADEMLNKGFREQLKSLFDYIPTKAQVCLVSATLPNEILELSKQILNDPISILVKNEELTLEGIAQYFVYLEKDDYKFETLCDLYENLSIVQAIIYCNSKRKVDEVVKLLNDNDHSVVAIHSEVPFPERERIMREFRSGSARVLVTTNLLARGIDLQQINLVINYDIPFKVEDYLHRIGRTGRFGRKGIAINFVTENDYKSFRAIEQHYNTTIKELPMDLGQI